MSYAPCLPVSLQMKFIWRWHGWTISQFVDTQLPLWITPANNHCITLTSQLKQCPKRPFMATQQQGDNSKINVWYFSHELINKQVILINIVLMACVEIIWGDICLHPTFCLHVLLMTPISHDGFWWIVMFHVYLSKDKWMAVTQMIFKRHLILSTGHFRVALKSSHPFISLWTWWTC